MIGLTNYAPVSRIGMIPGKVIELVVMLWTGLLKSIFGMEFKARSGARVVPSRPRQKTAPNPAAVLVIDTSPSMECTDWKPSRREAAKDAGVAFVHRLQKDSPNARVGIIAYGGRATVVCPLTPVRASSLLLQSITEIQEHSVVGTNIASGLSDAIQALQGVSGACQVVLLTDGHNNTGPCPKRVGSRLRRIATLECVGIGGSPGDVDEDLLRSIASENPDGSKRYRWIGQQEGREGLVRHFEKIAGGLARE